MRKVGIPGLNDDWEQVGVGVAGWQHSTEENREQMSDSITIITIINKSN